MFPPCLDLEGPRGKAISKMCDKIAFPRNVYDISHRKVCGAPSNNHIYTIKNLKSTP